ncbi:MAG: SpoIIE family protein phosphatase [Treponema sp.]|nr:SpoIIE family protein phosphatase [Treponema sp.]
MIYKSMIYSIRTKILLIVLVFLAFIGAAFLVYSIATTHNYKLLRLENIEKTVAYETEKVNKIITEIEHGTLLYNVRGMLMFENESEDAAERLAVEYIENYPVLTGGGFWFEPYTFKKDRQGGASPHAAFYAYREKPEMAVFIADRIIMSEYDYHNKSWYREILENISAPYEVIWTEPYVDYAEKFSIMTTSGVGIFNDNGDLIGITTADWEIDEVVKELTAIKPTPNSFILLCVPDKDYIISSTRTDEVTGVSISEIPWDITSDAFKLNGINYLRFGKYMDNGWLLSIQIPEKEIFAEVEKRNKRFSLIFLIVALVKLFIAWVLISKLINTPIKRLALDVSRIAFGNLDKQITVLSNDEIGFLAKVFNKMTLDLKKSIEEKTKEREEKERIRAELNVAAAIQTSMLPNVFPVFAEFDLHAAMIPAKEVCGDFYDFFFIDKDTLVVLVADVSGKGVPAALFMVVAKTLIKNCSSCKSPQAVFETVNNKLCENNEIGMFVTSFIGFYHLPTGKLTFVNAGHNPPLVKKNNKDFAFLKTDPCVILGFMKDIKYKQEEIYLEPGEVLCLYTDGVTEAMNNKKELFGEERLLKTVNKNTSSCAKGLLAAIKHDVDNFAMQEEQADDITMLALKIKDKNDKINYGQELRVTSEIKNLEKVIGFVSEELNKKNCLSDSMSEICIAAEEIFMNIVNHAYENSAGEVSIKISTDEKTVIRFEDNGKPYNPLEYPQPDLDKSIKDRPVGGLGIFLFRKLMDSAEYSRVNDCNVLVIAKKHCR